jgi:hypothetical protein
MHAWRHQPYCQHNKSATFTPGCDCPHLIRLAKQVRTIKHLAWNFSSSGLCCTCAIARGAARKGRNSVADLALPSVVKRHTHRGLTLLYRYRFFVVFVVLSALLHRLLSVPLDAQRMAGHMA